MKLEELSRLLREADPAAVLLPPSTLNWLVQKATGTTWAVWRVPHSHCLVVDRRTLTKHVDWDDLHLPPDHQLPEDAVLVLERPTADQLTGPRDALLGRYWRLLFHAAVHRAVEPKVGGLTPAAFRDRVEALGPAAFEEARNVLAHDGLLGADADDRDAYAEFAAFYLELRHFSPAQVAVYFPSLPPAAVVDALLAEDVDGAALFAKTRLAGAPVPRPKTDDQSDESHDYFDSLSRQANRAGRGGDAVRAAILHTEAARVAPGEKTAVARKAAREWIDRLADRLRDALGLPDEATAGWRRLLGVLLDKADQGNRPVEAALLYDLQRAAVEHEQPVYALDLARYLLSVGKRPLRRELVSRRFVRVPAHLRSAARRVAEARLTDADRQALTGLLRDAGDRAEAQLRAKFRPVLTDALHDAGLRPASLPEEAALKKTVEELLDRISAAGFLGFGDVRDAIARGQVKLPDLAGLGEYITGDPLLRLDNRLAATLDGVYRRAEPYTRSLERVTAVNFGTPAGRWLTRNVTLPFGAALLAAEFVWLLVHTGWEWRSRWWTREAVPEVYAGWNADWRFHAAWAALGVVILAAIHSAAVRGWLAAAGRTGYRTVRFFVWELPRRAWESPWVRRVLGSGAVQAALNFAVKPSALTAGVMGVLVLLGFEKLWSEWPVWAITFVAAWFVVNSGIGRALELLGLDALRAGVDLLRSFPAVLRWVNDLFREAVYAVEWVLARTEDWLRLRGDASRGAVAVRAVAGLFWMPVAFLVRLYTVVLIEPMVNPLKLPLSLLFAKFVYPLLLALGLFDAVALSSPLVEPLAPYLTWPVAWLLVIGTFWLSPDVVTFLFWEMRENWRLYRANRPTGLQPVHVGPHGETVKGLLHWGFHSGTVPRLYAKLRAAEAEAERTDNWKAARTHRQALREVEEAVKRFVVRDFVEVLNNPEAAWGGPRLAVGSVQLGTNRIKVELVPSEVRNAEFGVRNGEPTAGPESAVRSPQSAVLEWEDRSGWLVGRWADPGFVADLPAGATRVLADALAYLYKRAGVDLSWEQVRAELPKEAADFDVGPDGLLVWYGPRDKAPVVYDLADPGADLRPRSAKRRPVDEPVLDACRLVFARVPLRWAQWTEVWRPRPGDERPRFGPPDGDLVLLPPRPDVPPPEHGDRPTPDCEADGGEVSTPIEGEGAKVTS
ncbi:MAG: hypothetical protein K2X82_22070 [Gemmataceae bacterium]|nr:hypothetical protein [Gemmataceae bacterium]